MAGRRITNRIDRARTDELVSVLKAMAHPLRLGIVATLCEGEAHVAALATRLGAAQAIISQQLRILRQTKLVVVERSHRRAVYRLDATELRTFVQFARRCAVAIGDPRPRGAAPGTGVSAARVPGRGARRLLPPQARSFVRRAARAATE